MTLCCTASCTLLALIEISSSSTSTTTRLYVLHLIYISCH